MTRIVVLLLGLLLGCGLAAETNRSDIRLPDMGDAASRSLSLSQENRLGRELIREVRMRLPLERDPEVRSYIQELGHRLLAHADGPEFHYQFFVVDSPAINAFAMPGGNVGINSGLILRTRSESELGGVMAHELAHVTQRHIARRLDAQRGAGFRTLGVLMAAILLGMQDPEVGSAAAMTGLAGSIQEELNFSREHEREADNIGLQILARAELDPEGMPRFFERLQQATQYQSRPPEYLSTHPVTENRISDTRARARQLGTREVRESATYAMIRTKLLVTRAQTPDAAIRHFRAQLDNGDDPHTARFGLALALTEAGDAHEAVELVEHLIHEHGEYVPYYLALARAQWAAGDEEQALDTFALILELFPDNYPTVYYYAEALHEAGRVHDARSILRRQLQRGGPDPALYQRLAQVSSEAGLPHESRLAMAEYYQMHGQLRLAIEQLNQVIDARDAELYDKSRALSRRHELVNDYENRHR